MLIARVDKYKIVPWKNGNGQTTELIIEPDGSSVTNDFTLRISRAVVPTDGPFSEFRGYERVLIVTSGSGMVLRHQTEEMEWESTALKLEPVTFSGDAHTSARLIDGPCNDFNVIYKRDLPCKVTVIRNETIVELLPASRCLLHVIHGDCFVGEGVVLGPFETGELCEVCGIICTLFLGQC
jgi:environmental stress-induced protein Ves